MGEFTVNTRLLVGEKDFYLFIFIIILLFYYFYYYFYLLFLHFFFTPQLLADANSKSYC